MCAKFIISTTNNINLKKYIKKCEFLHKRIMILLSIESIFISVFSKEYGTTTILFKKRIKFEKGVFQRERKSLRITSNMMLPPPRFTDCIWTNSECPCQYLHKNNFTIFLRSNFWKDIGHKIYNIMKYYYYFFFLLFLISSRFFSAKD